MGDFFGYVRAERKRRGWSLDVAARRLGISKSRLREMESGISLSTGKPTSVTSNNLDTFATGYGLPRERLVALAYGSPDPVEGGADDEVLRLVGLYRAIPMEHRGLALKLLEAMGDYAPGTDFAKDE